MINKSRWYVTIGSVALLTGVSVAVLSVWNWLEQLSLGEYSLLKGSVILLLVTAFWGIGAIVSWQGNNLKWSNAKVLLIIFVLIAIVFLILENFLSSGSELRLLTELFLWLWIAGGCIWLGVVSTYRGLKLNL